MTLLLLLACGSAPTERMAPCPSSPNCVSSQATDEEHAVPAFEAADPAAALVGLASTLEGMDGFTEFVAREDGYLHATFTTPLMQYVDDLELQVGDGVVDVRSASRVGHSDLGVNRKRVEALRAAWAK